MGLRIEEKKEKIGIPMAIAPETNGEGLEADASDAKALPGVELAILRCRRQTAWPTPAKSRDSPPASGSITWSAYWKSAGGPPPRKNARPWRNWLRTGTAG